LSSEIDGEITFENLEPIDDVSANQGWPGAIPAPVLASARSPTDGWLYAAPLSVERDNTLFYNKRVFADAGLTPPKTMAEILTASETLESKGITPIAVSASGGWTVSFELFDILLAESSPQFYDDYLRGRKTADAPEMQQAIADLGKLTSHANADRATTGWDDAVRLVCSGQAAMTFLGDFTREEFENDGCGPDTIAYLAIEPADAPTFVFAGGGFALFRDGAHRDTAIAFLNAVGSQGGQEGYATVAEATPARTDVDPSKFDAISRQTLLDFRSPSETLVQSYSTSTSFQFQTALSGSVQQYVDPASSNYQNAAFVLDILRQNYAAVKP
jgi:glucose/mannose transport system substrate-binding protein